MRVWSVGLLLALITTPLAAQQAAPQALPSVTLPAELDRVLRDYEQRWAAGNATGLADIFTEDGFVNSSGGWRRGRPAILETYARAGGALRLRAHAWAVADTVGYIVGAYTYGAEGGPDRGKFLLALRRTRGGPWLIAADLDSANR